MKTINDFKKLIEDGVTFFVKADMPVFEKWFDGAEVVHIDTLIGKKVSTFTQGYEDQYYIDEFVVGGIKPRYTFFNDSFVADCGMNHDQLVEKYGYVIIDQDGNNTSIFLDATCSGIFCCSDSDRFTHFVIED